MILFMLGVFFSGENPKSIETEIKLVVSETGGNREGLFWG